MDFARILFDFQADWFPGDEEFCCNAVAPCNAGCAGVVIKPPRSMVGIVNELPLVVVVLVIEFANALLFADAGNTYNRPAAKNLCWKICRRSLPTGLDLYLLRIDPPAPTSPPLAWPASWSESSPAAVAAPAPVAAWFELFPPSIELAPAPPSGDRTLAHRARCTHCRCTDRRCAGYGAPAEGCGSRYSRRAGQLHFAHMQQFEVFVGERILIALSQEADVVGVFQFFEARRVPACLLDITADCPRILDSRGESSLLRDPGGLEMRW